MEGTMAQSSAYAALVNAEENQPVSAPEVTQADEEVLGELLGRLKHQLQQEQKQATKAWLSDSAPDGWRRRLRFGTELRFGTSSGYDDHGTIGLRAIADRQFTEPSELEAGPLGGASRPIGA
ncbi:unnamed protein product [Durusdinium trenchii]|uniref:Uncharacterized protein n=1 Tax=Durusdinium trenchii TaxID=1381693 RepID=A0ABP0PJ61_9DINO